MIFNYDEAYQQPGLYWGANPNRIAQMVIDLIPEPQGKRIVDLGAGEGRDLIAFAKAGFDPLGIDLSEIGLAKAREWAEREGLTIQTQQASLVDVTLTGPVDVLYASGAITYLPPELRAERFAHFKAVTPIGGIHVFNAFVEKPYMPLAPDWGADEFHFRSGEIPGHYWDWEILHVNAFEFDCNSSGVPHRHAMEVLIARKVLV